MLFYSGSGDRSVSTSFNQRTIWFQLGMLCDASNLDHLGTLRLSYDAGKEKPFSVCANEFQNFFIKISSLLQREQLLV